MIDMPLTLDMVGLCILLPLAGVIVGTGIFYGLRWLGETRKRKRDEDC